MIQWQNGIPYRQDRLLCSPRDPAGEACRWLARQMLLPEDKSVGVIGLGFGAHVLELAKARPDVKIFCLEMDQELIRHFNTSNSQIQFVTPENLPMVDIVLSFRPSWQGYENEYQTCLQRWSGSSVLAASHSFAEHGFMWMASTLSLLPENQTGVRLNQLPIAPEENKLSEVKYLKALTEIIK